MSFPFPPRPPIDGAPLIGQPFEVLGWTIVVAGRCRCGDGTPQMLTLSSGQNTTLVVRCAACRKTWALGKDTKLALNVALVLGAPDGTAAGAVTP